MKIRTVEMPKTQYSIKCPYSMTPIGVAVHNTANDASATNEIAYMQRNNMEVSFHYAVDDKEAILGSPLDRNTWHASDGKNGEGNRKYISIEICYSLSGGEQFIKAEQNAAVLIAQILHEHNWGVDRVKKHNDFCGKYCPHRTLDMGWDRFIAMIQKELERIGGSDITDNKNKPEEWAKEAVEWALKNEIMYGDGTGNLQLKEPCTREQLCVFLYRLYNLIVGEAK